MKPSLWLLTSALILGCGDDCADIGCGPSFLVELVSEDWQDGEYELTVEAGDDSTTCTFSIENGESVTGPCDPAIADLDMSELSEGFVLLRFQSARPSELTVSLENADGELASDTFEPEYEEVEVSPDACGGPCTGAQVSLEVPESAP